MSERLAIGDRVRSNINNPVYTVKSVHTTESGKVQYWVHGGNDDSAHSLSASIEDWERIKPFFEEGVTYRINEGRKFTVWHVHQMANGRVAVGQWTNEVADMLRESCNDFGRAEKV